MRKLLFIVCLISGLAHARPLYDFSSTEDATRAMLSAHALEGGSLRHAHRGQVVHVAYFGSYQSHTRIPIASASKWLSALVIARLVDKGQLGWSDTVGAWLPQSPSPTHTITMEQLFSHTSGILGGEATACLSNRFTSLAACTQSILQLPLESTPGTAFSYGGNSMQVAGRIAELASGKDWNQLFFEEVVVPLSLTGTDFATGSSTPGYVWVDNPRVAGGVRSTLEDYGRVLDMVLAEGMVGTQRYLGADTLRYMRRDQTAGKTILSTPSPEALGYGIGQWIEAVDAQGQATRTSSPGAFGTTPWADVSCSCSGIIFVQDARSRLVGDLYAIQNAAINAMRQWRYLKPPPLPPEAVLTSGTSASSEPILGISPPAQSHPQLRRGPRRRAIRE